VPSHMPQASNNKVRIAFVIRFSGIPSFLAPLNARSFQ
jgi:hypothetical protein